jgi:hypothetical protein
MVVKWLAGRRVQSAELELATTLAESVSISDAGISIVCPTGVAVQKGFRSRRIPAGVAEGGPLCRIETRGAMKTLKPKLEMLESRALLSGLWDPGPGGGAPLPTGPLGVPILAGKGGEDALTFQPPGGTVQTGNEIILLAQEHWENGGFEDLERAALPGDAMTGLTLDDSPDPPAPGGGGGGGGILGWPGNLFGGGEDQGSENADAGPGHAAAVEMVFSGSALRLEVPPDVDLPGPAPQAPETMVRLPSQPTTVADLFDHSDEKITLRPGSTTLVHTSSDGPALGVAGTTLEPGPNIFYDPRAPQGGSNISIEFVGAGIVDPRSRDTVYVLSPRDAETPVAVSVPDGGTVLLGGVKASPKSITLVEVLVATKSPSATRSPLDNGRVLKTVDKDEVITIGSDRARERTIHVDAIFGRLGQQASGLFGDASVRQIQAHPKSGIIAVLIGL